MNTKLARDLGLEFPIFAFTHCRDVAAAVSKAGGMGVFGVAASSASELRAELDIYLILTACSVDSGVDINGGRSTPLELAISAGTPAA